MTMPKKKKSVERFRIPARRLPIYFEIEIERRAQDTQSGGSALDNRHSIGEWIALVSKQVGQASAESSKESVRNALIKAAALCCAAIEALDRA